MSNKIWCRKKFISDGETIIEMADINIRNIQVFIDNNKIDRTEFLKYGNAYESVQKIDKIELICNNDIQIDIEKTDEGLYYFNYDNIDIDVKDKLVICNSDSNNIVYCIVTDVKDNRVFFEYYTKDVLLISPTYTKLQIIKYIDIEEYTVTYDLTIKDIDREQEYIIPIFLPDMKQNLSAKKNILIHVNNNIEKISFILLGKKDLTLNSIHSFEYSKDINCSGGYKTFIVCLLYNGDKSWFVI